MKRTLIALVLALTLLLGGCAAPQSDAAPDTSAENHQSQTDAPGEEMFTSRDRDTSYDESAAAAITLSGSSASCTSNAVRIDGTTVTITDEGTYLLTGTLTGQLIIDADESDKPHLVLRDVTIHSDTSAPLYVRSCDKLVVTLEGENTLSCGESFTAMDENNMDGAVFSKQDLTFNGSGSLSVTSPAGHGIVCKDDLVFTGGSYTVASSGHGIDANDSFRTVDATFAIDAGKDGVHAENNDDASLGFVYVESGSFTVEAEGDGLSASAHMTLLGGTYDIKAGGGSENAAAQSSDNWGGFMGGGGMMRPGGMGGPGGGKGGPGGVAYTTQTTDTAEDSTSMKGIKAGGALTVSGGPLTITGDTFTIDAADDAVHSNTDVTISGGAFTAASGDDGVHADETLTITDGSITVSKSYEGLEGLDIVISGGKIHLTCRDDGINAAGGTDQSGMGGRDQFGGGPGGMSAGNGSIEISGGDIYMNASGDGIDANGTLEIRGGFVVVCGPIQGDTAVLDYDKTAIITGGTFIGTGSTMMAQTFTDDSTQGVFAVTVGSQSAGTPIVLTDGAGNTVIDYAPDLPFGLVILSSGDIVKGEAYTITVGTASGTFAAN